MNQRHLHPAKASAFTLLELILVMLILSIAAGMIVPSLVNFAVNQTSENTAQQVLDLARYAETQSVTEARPYRLNFDQSSGDIWLTAADSTGTFKTITDYYDTRVSLGKSMKMTVQITVQPMVQWNMNSTIAPSNVQPTPAFGQPVVQSSNAVLQMPHADGTYAEFSSTGRVDPTLIQLVDRYKKEIDLGCATPLEKFHRLTKQEMQ